MGETETGGRRRRGRQIREMKTNGGDGEGEKGRRRGRQWGGRRGRKWETERESVGETERETDRGRHGDRWGRRRQWEETETIV